MDRSWKRKLLRRLAPLVASAALASCSDVSDSPLAMEQGTNAGWLWEVSDAPCDFLTPPAHELPARVVAAEAAAESEFYRPRLRRLPPLSVADDGSLARLPALTHPAADAAALAQFGEETAALIQPPVKLEPLQVPTIDLSEALAAIAHEPMKPQPIAAQAAQPTGRADTEARLPTVAPPAPATAYSRWSDHLHTPPPSIEQPRAAAPPSARQAPGLFTSHAPTQPGNAAPVGEVRRLPVLTDEAPRRIASSARHNSPEPPVLGPPQFVNAPAPVAAVDQTPSQPSAQTPAAPVSPPIPNVAQVQLPSAEELAMQAVQSRTEAQIRHAFSLARRGAHYSAKAELVEVLRTTTQALDMRDGTKAHSDALARAFRALDEAGDFQPRGAGLESNLDMALLVAGHQSPVLKDEDLTKITPLAALQRYYTYAQKQFAAAGDGQPTASAALYGLGRLQSLMSGPTVGGLSEGAPQAMVFHQAAVTIDGANYKSANELGVLLARYGQYASAREMLIHSVRVSPKVQSWQNLSVVHEKLGEMDLARRAMHEARLVASGRTSTVDADSLVRWVPPEALARSAPQSDDVLISPASSRTSPAAEPQSREVRGIMKFLPWTRAGE